jgi:hypothetical protein
MSSDLLRLVSDTLSLFREDTKWIAPAPTPVPKKPEIVQAAPTPPPQQPKEPPQQVPKKEIPSIISKIQKHLPHLQLLQTIPLMKQVALVSFFPEDLPFLKNLKSAIEKHHCPVKLIQGEQKLNWDAFTLVIAQKDVGAKKQIVLASIATYQNNTEQKKVLWSSICNHLSSKSS